MDNIIVTMHKVFYVSKGGASYFSVIYYIFLSRQFDKGGKKNFKNKKNILTSDCFLSLDLQNGGS